MSEQLQRQYRQLHHAQMSQQQLQKPQHWPHYPHLPHQQQQQQQQLSPDRALAALPESYVQSSTPECSCPMRLLRFPSHQMSPCTPSSSLLSFSDSSASFSSDLDSLAASPQAVQLAVDRRRLRLVHREEAQLRRLLTDLDSRARPASGVSDTGVDKDLLALRRMSVEGMLHTVQMHASAQSEKVTAAAHRSAPPPHGPGGKCDNDSDSDNCSLLDF